MCQSVEYTLEINSSHTETSKQPRTWNNWMFQKTGWGAVLKRKKFIQFWSGCFLVAHSWQLITSLFPKLQTPYSTSFSLWRKCTWDTLAVGQSYYLKLTYLLIKAPVTPFPWLIFRTPAANYKSSSYSKTLFSYTNWQQRSLIWANPQHHWDL